MIDYLALSIGHGLLAIAFMRLVMRDGLNVDPLLDQFRERERERRKARQTNTREKGAREKGPGA